MPFGPESGHENGIAQPAQQRQDSKTHTFNSRRASMLEVGRGGGLDGRGKIILV